MILRQSQKQIVAIKTSSIKILYEYTEERFDIEFQFQLVRLKLDVPTTTSELTKFQFQLVRLKFRDSGIY